MRMNGWQRFLRRGVFTVLVVLMASTVTAQELHKQQCRHFILLTDLDGQDTVLIAHQLDRIYDIFSNPAQPIKTDNGLPLVYIFQRRTDFFKFARERMNDPTISTLTSGLFGKDKLTGRFCISTYTENDPFLSITFNTLQHECTHYFMKAMLPDVEALPKWIHEGAAVFYEHLSCKNDGTVLLGLVPYGRWKPVVEALETDTCIPLRDLLQRPPSSFPDARLSLCYGQAWSLYYFFYFAYDGKFRAPFNIYLDRLPQIKDRIALLEEVFNCKLDELERAWARNVMHL
jgi:hypothetical protein